MTTKEPVIMVNGVTLNGPESRTVRVAIESLASDLQENGLGNDDHGMKMKTYYLRDVANLRNLIFIPDDQIPKDPERSIVSAISHLDNAKVAMEAGDEGSAKNALEAAREALLGAVRIGL